MTFKELKKFVDENYSEEKEHHELVFIYADYANTNRFESHIKEIVEAKDHIQLLNINSYLSY